MKTSKDFLLDALFLGIMVVALWYVTSALLTPVNPPKGFKLVSHSIGWTNQ